jgi:hypothetical protein
MLGIRGNHQILRRALATLACNSCGRSQGHPGPNEALFKRP